MLGKFGRSSESLETFENVSVSFGGLLEGLGKLGRLWASLGEYWVSLGEFWRVWESYGEFGRVWESLGEYGRV